ncbi:MAG: flagellar biosynthetic protein FliQ [Opitutales bacterium]|nr:flagellar biosynthetic protein FliQ [Opitutales bacterium]
MAIDVFQTMIKFALQMVSPILFTAIGVGVAVSVAQTITSIQEQTLTFVPKLFAVSAVMIVGGGWFLTGLINYAQGVFELIGTMGR